MKSVVVLALLAVVHCELNSENFDWTTLKPIQQIKEYREAFPRRFINEVADDSARVFDRNGRIIRGNVAGPTDFPFAV
jgi:hypothetical protein